MADVQVSKLTSKGQTTLPKDVRTALRLEPGDTLLYLVLDGEVRLLKARPLSELKGMLRRPGQKSVSLAEMEEGIAAGATE